MGERLSNVLYRQTPEHLAFWCPGCDSVHTVSVSGSYAWGWNQSAEKPTFTPSVLCRGKKMTAKGRADYEAWCAAGYPQPAPASFESENHVCHSFVTDGQINFLSDCTHALAGQTVPLPDLPDWLGEE